MRSKLVLGLVAILCVFGQTANAGKRGNWNQDSSNSNLPGCEDFDGRPLQVNNRQVLEWKQSTKNQFKDRGYVTGVLVGVIQQRPSHLHLDVFLGETQSGTGKDSDIELIYNREFGDVNVNNLRPGMEVSACGDYITSNKDTPRYKASPLGAILHWIHKATGGTHPSGFLMIDGQLYGAEDPSPYQPRQRGGYNQGGQDEQGYTLQDWFKLAI